MKRWLLPVLISVLLHNCKPVDKKPGKLVIEKEHLFEKIPSGSGLVLHGDSVFIIADDAPYIYEVALKDYSYNMIPLQHYGNVGYRIPKPVKPDFETAAMTDVDGQKIIFGFGSGSVSPTRDSLIMINAAQPADQRTVPVTSLFRHTQATIGIKPEQWNLEGAVMTKDTLLLMNRGSNSVISMALSDFFLYLKEEKLPALRHYTISIPQLERYVPRISGACAMDNDNEILFCASIEDTPNWYTDGPVVGSGVGIFDKRTGALKAFELIYKESGGIALEKVESVELVKREADGTLRLLAVVDDDQGHTKLLHLTMHR